MIAIVAHPVVPTKRWGAGVCLEWCMGVEIERRPRGASRINPLLHLLQRDHVCEAMVVSLVGMTGY
jgi:hypothetical protein